MARLASSIAAESAFRQRLADLGAVLLEPEWLGSTKRHHVRCAAGHDSYVQPTNGMRWGICRTCAGKDPAVAEAAFRAALAELDATPLFDRYRGANRPHHVRCAEGHDCHPRPSHVRQGYGICRKCGNRQIDSPRSRQAEDSFRATLLRLGATPLFTEWLGTGKPHEVRCPSGHLCQLRPAALRADAMPCRTCAGQNSALVEAAFRHRLIALGATPMFDTYLGNKLPHRAICAAGHECSPRWHALQRGDGPCLTCADRDPVAAEAKFRAALAAFGATPLFTEWCGASRGYYARCSAGHECWPWPSNAYRGVICKTCGGNDTAAAEASFRARVTELGGTCLFTEWRGVRATHNVRCPQGHESCPYPANVLRGAGICRTCAGKTWDVFYAVTSPLVVKFGITSGDPRPRLANHAKRGYSTVVRLVTGLPGTVAVDTETAVKAALALADERPVRGKEYFDISCLALVLDVADSWLIAEVPS